jgi:lipid II:glycine glycyltransferase (peptidoglycan interpeptide bridge formation enzyme)
MKSIIQLFINEKISVKTEEEWNEFNRNACNANVFQTPELYSFWLLQNNSKPFVFIIRNSIEEIVGICSGIILSNGNNLVSYFTRRAVIYGGPLFLNEESKGLVLQDLIFAINEKISKKAIYVEFRNFIDLTDYKDLFEKSNYKYLPYQNYLITLDNEENVQNKFKSEKRRQIRRALKEGVTFSVENTKANIHGVYNILQKIYKEKVKKPLPGLSFFEDLCELESANVMALHYEGNVIGGGFFLKDQKTIYDWYRGGLDGEYKHQYPSTLAAWALMQHGLNLQLEFFDFMGGGLKGSNYGVGKFKSQFGGELVEYGRFLKQYNSFLYKLGKLGMKLLKS